MAETITFIFLAIAVIASNVNCVFLHRRIKALEAWQQDAADQHERTAASFRLDENDFDRQLL